MAKKSRPRQLVPLWSGKAARIIGQSSDGEVRELARLIFHRGLTREQKYLVLENAIYDVWTQRKADRDDEARERRKRNRAPSHEPPLQAPHVTDEPIEPDSLGQDTMLPDK